MENINNIVWALLHWVRSIHAMPYTSYLLHLKLRKSHVIRASLWIWNHTLIQTGFYYKCSYEC